MDYYKQLGSNVLDLNNDVTELSSSLAQNGISTSDLFDAYELNERDQLAQSFEEPTNLYDHFYDSLKSVLYIDTTDNLFQYDCISTGLPSVDKLLAGGIPIGEITEIYGASGCGKSQFSFQLMSNCYSLYPGSKSIHVSTESYLESTRLKDIFVSSSKALDALDSVSQIYCQSLESQDHIFYTQLPILLSEGLGRYKLLVIDSIAQHFRGEDSLSNTEYLKRTLFKQDEAMTAERIKSEMKESQTGQLRHVSKTAKYASRTSKLYYITQLYRHLSRLAHEYQIAIVLINQVSDHTFDTADDQDIFQEELTYPLNLDFQTLLSSGWDPTAIYSHLSCFEQFAFEDEENRVKVELDELLNDRENKKSKVASDSISDSNKSLTAKKKALARKHLMEKAFNLKGRVIKKYVPTLGYSWTSRIKTRIMLSKSYKPSYKNESKVDYPTMDSKCSLNEENRDASYPMNSENLCNENLDIDCWQVNRYLKVVSSNNYEPNLDESHVVLFKIEKNGLVESSQ